MASTLSHDESLENMLAGQIFPPFFTPHFYASLDGKTSKNSAQTLDLGKAKLFTLMDF